MLHVVRFLADLKLHFCGIYASNSLPTRVTQFPSTVLCNTDPIEEKGSQWIAFWFRDFIDRNSIWCVYNNVQVQPDFAST